MLFFYGEIIAKFTVAPGAAGDPITCDEQSPCYLPTQPLLKFMEYMSSLCTYIKQFIPGPIHGIVIIKKKDFGNYKLDVAFLHSPTEVLSHPTQEGEKSYCWRYKGWRKDEKMHMGTTMHYGVRSSKSSKVCL